ncbi:hypothetical protein SXIM_31720 [Streptomyces xiamenensis]|uniref:Uncharacterized protein n=1 Tax=Streptomyces xiamenensis TaxID=408015 RepID=A0A0F7CPF2_9ACTN|nr:hypothetical protein SXIM_31720 [Streptomyces xiamenensis]
MKGSSHIQGWMLQDRAGARDGRPYTLRFLAPPGSRPHRTGLCCHSHPQSANAMISTLTPRVQAVRPQGVVGE